MLETIKQQTRQKEKQLPDYVGSKDLTDPENINIKTATIEITHENNVYNQKTSITDRVSEEEQLSTSEWIKVIDKFSRNGVENVVLTGGEPTLHEDFHEILQYCINSFNDVTVQTHGNTPKVLSEYNCNVSITIDSFDPVFNAEIFRKTDPEMYEIDTEKRKVVSKTEHLSECRYCGKTLKNANGLRMHIRHNHEEQAIEDYNEGVQNNENFSKVKEWDKLREIINSDDNHFNWFLYSYQERSLATENALSRAVKKIRNIDNPTTIRATIYNDNDLPRIMTAAEMLDVNTVFVPLKPAGKAKEHLLNQVPSPGRMYEAMNQVHDVNTVISTDHTVKSPMFEAFKYRKIEELSELTEKQEEQMKKFWERGRISTIGIDRIGVKPDGKVIPSKHIRQDKYVLGDIKKDEWENIEKEICEFNKILDEKIEPRIGEGFDLRDNCIFADPEVILNYPY